MIYVIEMKTMIFFANFAKPFANFAVKNFFVWTTILWIASFLAMTWNVRIKRDFVIASR